MSQNFKTRGYHTNGSESMVLNQFRQTRGLVKQSLGHLFLPEVALIFFNKTDLEQYRLEYFCQMGL